MIDHVPPAFIVIFGALLVPLLPGRFRGAYMVLLPALSLVHLLGLDHGSYGQVEVFGYVLTLLRIDKLSFVFGLIFHIATILSVIYALHEKDAVQQVAGLIYAGSAIGAVFAGDLIALFVYWELTAIASVFLIWARRTERAYHTGMRYLLIQVGSGVLLLSGVLLRVQAGYGLAFDHIGLEGPGSILILLAFGIKCAFPLLHAWLPDAYPEATPTGTVFLSAFTTKLAVYALARGYAGAEVLIPIGAAMAIFPLFYAAVENDLRRALAYCLNNQLGFMVIGVGIGSELALNGVAAHAFSHILYKSLLFMAVGAVLYRAGTAQASDLGGLYRSMPATMVFALLGAASVSGPLFCGFVSKALIVSAAAEGHHTFAWVVLLFGSAGVFLVAGIRVPFLAFFNRDAGIRCKEAPPNMLVAMGGTAALCVLVGLFPGQLYGMLPYAMDYDLYTVGHVVMQVQLLAFSGLAFALLWRKGLYPRDMRAQYLDADWLYRRLFPAAVLGIARVGGPLKEGFFTGGKTLVFSLLNGMRLGFGTRGLMARMWLTGSSVLFVMIFLMVCLAMFYY